MNPPGTPLRNIRIPDELWQAVQAKAVDEKTYGVGQNPRVPRTMG